MQAYIVGQPDGPQPAHGYQPPQPRLISMSEQPPVRVVMAMSFVAHCNEYMGLRGFTLGSDEEGYTSHLERLELHPAQEGAFRLALNCIGNYFAGKDLNSHGSCQEHGARGEAGSPGEPVA